MRCRRISVCACFLAVELYGQGQQQHQQRPGWPCAGGRPVDPTYVAIAEGTGGHLYMLGPAETAQAGSLMAWKLTHKVTVFRAMGEMREGGAEAREFSFPGGLSDREPGAHRVASIVRSRSRSWRLRASKLPGERVDFRAGRALRVVRPTPGPWKVRLAGRGLFFVTAEAASELSLDAARFVQPGGRAGHEGLSPVKRPPMLGSQGLLELELARGPAQNVRVQLVASDGRLLERLEVEPQAEGGGGSSSLLVRIPLLRHLAFRIAVEGVDRRGWPFQRMHAPLTTVASQ
jgi:hypothetical protein